MKINQTLFSLIHNKVHNQPNNNNNIFNLDSNSNITNQEQNTQNINNKYTPETTQTISFQSSNTTLPFKNSFQKTNIQIKKSIDPKTSFPSKLEKPKSFKPLISQECLSLINKIQAGNKPNYATNLTELPIPIVSQRSRYEEFSKDNIEFILPVAAKHLITIVQAVDQYLFLTKSRGGSNFFQGISQSLMSTARLTFQLTDFRKIIKIWNEIYEYKWMVNEKMQNKDKYDLWITLPDSNSFSNRREQFKNKILNDVRLKHDQFLIDNNLEWNKNMNSQLCLWHEEFQVHSIEFENGELPEKPKEIKQLDQSTRAPSSLLTVKFDTNAKLQPDISRSRLQGEAAVGCLGDKILQKIREKEKHMVVVQRGVDCGSEFLIRISGILFHHYKSRGTHTMFIVQVVEFLIRQNGLFSMCQYMRILNELCAYTNGFTICQVNEDEIIKLNGNMNLFEIQQEIKQNKQD